MSIQLALVTGRCDFVIAAHNEEATVGAVVRAVRAATCSHSVIVIADCCEDATAAQAQAASAQVIAIAAGDKGTAMARGLELVTAPRVGFIDADLEGLRPEHLDALAQYPTEMAIGLRSGSPDLIASTPLPPIGGERILPTFVAVAADLDGSGYEAEMKLNLAAKQLGVRTVEVAMPGVRHPAEIGDMHPIKQLRLWSAVARGCSRLGGQ